MMSWIDNVMNWLAVGALGADAQLVEDQREPQADAARTRLKGSDVGSNPLRKEPSRPPIH